MKKKVLALVLAASMAASMATSVSVFAEAEAATATVADLPTEAQFEPNKDYDKYTVVEYTIEDIQADLVCTVSAKEDNSEFYLECNFYGDDQMTRTTYDGKEFTVEEDKTGFMKGDTPAILEKAIEQNVWVPMDGAAASDDAKADDAKADDAKEIKGVTEDKLPAEPQFEANKDYDKWTVVEYTIEDIQADLVCTVSAKEDNSEFYLECNFYGDDQMTKTTYDGKDFTVEEDKTGFMKGDTPAILEKAIEQDLWVYFDNGADAAAAADDAATDGATATAADLPAEPQFEPNKDYDEYTVVEYTIEDIQADLVCTVSTNKDHTEFYLECNFYGDDQMTKTTYDGKEYKVEEDKTGFMKGDTPAILDKALEQNIWVPIGDAAASDDAKADDKKEIKGVTEDQLPAEPMFEANKDYDKWTVVEYTIEDIQADLVCTVSAKEDNSEFYLECNFYGDDQMTKTTYDGKEYTVEEDKTGFMKGDTPAILDKAIEQDLWVYFDNGADDADAADAEATDGAAATAADLPAEAQFEPNKDYDEYTVVEYTIEDIQADLVCTVSTNKDHTEFYLECNFYGDDQMTKTTYDGKEYTVEEDKTGFMKGDTPAILDKAIEQNIWVTIEK